MPLIELMVVRRIGSRQRGSRAINWEIIEIQYYPRSNPQKVRDIYYNNALILQWGYDK